MISLCVLSALAADLTVGPAGTYATLDDALLYAVDGDRLLVEPGTYTEPVLAVGARTIVVEATALGVMLQSTSSRRAFTVQGGDLTVVGLAIDLQDDIGLVELRGGRFELRDAGVLAARAPIPGQPGGSIDAADGAVVVIRSVLEGAVAPVKDGGHIYALRTDVVIDGSTLSAGDASAGGAVFVDEGSLEVSDSTFSGNLGGDGGAVDVRNGSVTLTNTTFDGSVGRALFVAGGAITATDTSFSGNSGGGVSVSGGSLSATSSTFENNGGAEGVAVLAVGSDVSIVSSHFEGNAASVADVVRCDGGTSCVIDAPTFEGNGGAGALLSVRGVPGDVRGAIACMQDGSGPVVSVEGGGTLAMTGSAIFANAWSGSALTVAADSSATLLNNSLVFQQANGSLVDAAGPLVLTNNLVALTTSTAPAVVANGGLSGGYNLYFGNTGGDVSPGPLVTDVLGADPLIGEPKVGVCDLDALKPRYGSPLVDGGDPDISDPDGSISDIGAFGGKSPNPDPGTEDDDLDGDGFGIPADCNDEDPSVSPAEPETGCNGIDDDCNPDTIDNIDADGDGVGVCDDDCDDQDASVFEIVDVYLDKDLDGYGIGETTPFCLPPNNSSLVDGDCDDTDPIAYPGAPEIPYDGIDQDCDGSDLDDLDGDGALGAVDCDDEDAERFPFNDEVPDDGIDQDCTGNDVVTTLNGGAGWRCGCSSSSPAGASVPLLLMLAALLRRRRR